MAKFFKAKTNKRIEVKGYSIVSSGYIIEAGELVQGMFYNKKYSIARIGTIAGFYADVTRKDLIDFQWIKSEPKKNF